MTKRTLVSLFHFLLLLALGIIPRLARGQVARGQVVSQADAASIRPVLELGLRSSTNGYLYPYPEVAGGVQYESRRFYSEDLVAYDFLVYKKGVSPSSGTNLGGQAFGLRSKDYVLVSPRLGVGGGIDYVHLSTPVWDKQSLLASAGVRLPIRSNRLYLDYFRHAAYDQNHLQYFQLSLTFGRGRIRPVLKAAVSSFTEPSYCTTLCVSHWGFSSELAVKFLP